jgi:hypothetical protein
MAVNCFGYNQTKKTRMKLGAENGADELAMKKTQLGA